MPIPLSKPEKNIQNKTCFRFVLFIQAAEFRYAWPRIWISGYRMFFQSAEYIQLHICEITCYVDIVPVFFQFNF